MTTPYVQPDPGVWNPWGSTTNIWNSASTDGSVPWDVAMSMGLAPGATYGAQGYGGSGSSQKLYADTGSDPYLKSALDRLRGTIDGTNLPYDATTKANMLSQASDMNAAAESSNAEDLRARAAAGGASLNDPASQAALAQLKSTRQQGNMQAAQGIESKANLANFGAQQDAANSLSSTRLQEAQINPYYSGTPRVFTGTSWGPAGATGGTSGGTATGGATNGGATSGGTATTAPTGYNMNVATSGGYNGVYNPTAGTSASTATATTKDTNPDHYGWRAQWLAARNNYYNTSGRNVAGSYGWQ